jgi:DNA processing protein
MRLHIAVPSMPKEKRVPVFGAGVAIILKERLAQQIVALGGALISEFPMNTLAAPQNFSIRKRIISGISVGVLVIEAAEYGPNTLIKQGAKLTATWENVWEELPPQV